MHRNFIFITMGLVLLSACTQQADDLSESNNTAETPNEYIGAAYTVTYPDGWNPASSGNPSLAIIQKIKDGCDWDVARRGCEMGNDVFSSNPSTVGTCGMQTLDECLATLPAGSFVTISTSYRPENTIEEVIANDESVLGLSRTSELTIAGQTTYELGIACEKCTYARRFVFNAQPHVTVTIDAVSFGTTDDALLLAPHEEAMQQMLGTMSVRPL